VAKVRRDRKWLIALALVLVLVAVSGCETLSFYKQAIGGQYEIISHQRPSKRFWLRHRRRAVESTIGAAQSLLDFAERTKAGRGRHYRKYADVHRPFAV